MVGRLENLYGDTGRCVALASLVLFGCGEPGAEGGGASSSSSAASSSDTQLDSSTGDPVSDPAAEFIDELVLTACELRAGCTCEPALDEMTCRAEFGWQYERRYGLPEEVDLVFDQACADSMLAAYPTDVACEPFSVAFPRLFRDCDRCKPFVGTRARGDDCTDYNTYDDCAQGLRCIGGECVDACVPADVNDVCLGRECAAGLGCQNVRDDSSDSEDYLCLPYVGAGETCDAAPCEPPLSCQNFRCQATPSIGEECFGYCQAGAYCAKGVGEPDTCAPIPQPGEACGADEACEAGAPCSGGVCQPEPPYICDPWL